MVRRTNLRAADGRNAIRWPLAVGDRVHVTGVGFGEVAQVGKVDVAIWFRVPWNATRVFLWDHEVVPIDTLLVPMLEGLEL